MRKNSLTRATAVLFGSALLLGAAACSDEEAQENIDQATDAVSTAAEDAQSAIEDATGDMGGDGGNGGDVDTEDVGEGDLQPEVTDAAAGAEAEGAPLGEFQSAERAGDNVVAEYADGWVVSGPESGTHVLRGMIGETWMEDGGLGNDVGLPTGPEAETEGGWEQPFTNGVLKWVEGENGEFEAVYE